MLAPRGDVAQERIEFRVAQRLLELVNLLLRESRQLLSRRIFERLTQLGNACAGQLLKGAGPRNGARISILRFAKIYLNARNTRGRDLHRCLQPWCWDSRLSRFLHSRWLSPS